MKPTTCAELFDRMGNRWDSDARRAHAVAQALREVVDRHERFQRAEGYGGKPTKKPRYDGKACHPVRKECSRVKTLRMIERSTHAGIVERERAAERTGLYKRITAAPAREVDLVGLSPEELQARVDAGRAWVAQERAKICR